jgi:ubiquinone/menaquinone biosynthesis C-methylase UbiE
MGLGRRKARLGDSAAWVFNRMADVYPARPAYPEPLVAALAGLVPPGGRVLDVGAGTGHLALPLAERGFAVTALEPAAAMLAALGERADRAGLSLCSLHGQGEAVPLPAQSCELVLVADALHFLDAELTGREIGRLLTQDGVLALVTCEFADTPFMRALVERMEQAAPRRPRATERTSQQLFRQAGVGAESQLDFEDHTLVNDVTLERILRSISFIGPAMNPERFAAFKGSISEIAGPTVWSRAFSLRWARRR